MAIKKFFDKRITALSGDTLPDGDYKGQIALLTDTDQEKVWTGSAWLNYPLSVDVDVVNSFPGTNYNLETLGFNFSKPILFQLTTKIGINPGETAEIIVVTDNGQLSDQIVPGSFGTNPVGTVFSMPSLWFIPNKLDAIGDANSKIFTFLYAASAGSAGPQQGRLIQY